MKRTAIAYTCLEARREDTFEAVITDETNRLTKRAGEGVAVTRPSPTSPLVAT